MNINFVLDQIDDLRLDPSVTSEGVYALDKLRARITNKPAPDKYYKIIGGYSGVQIGKCHYIGIGDVREEEPRATFEEISKEEYEREDDWYKMIYLPIGLGKVYIYAIVNRTTGHIEKTFYSYERAKRIADDLGKAFEIVRIDAEIIHIVE